MSSPRRRVKRAIPAAKEPISMQSVALRPPNKGLIGSVTLSLVLALLLFWKFAPANSAPKASDIPLASTAVTSFTGEVAKNSPLVSSRLTPVDVSDHGTVGNPTITSIPAHQGEAGARWRRVVDKKIENGMVMLTLKDDHTGELSRMTQPLGTNVDVQEGEGKAFILTSTPVSAKAELPTQGIETIKAGMTVPSRDPITGKTEFKKVARTFKHTVYEIVKLELADGKTGKEVDTLKGTPTHPFFTPSGMVAMGDLKPEMKVITRRGPPLVVKSVTREPHPEGIAVYNFEVEGDHTYFVGKAEGGTWVHNDCFTPAEESIANYLRGLGRNVSKNPLEGVVGAGRQGDAYVDGVLHEFKTLDPGATSSTVRNVVNGSLKGSGQGRNIVIDARGSGLSLFEAQHGVRRAFGSARGRLDRITIIGDGYFWGAGP